MHVNMATRIIGTIVSALLVTGLATGAQAQSCTDYGAFQPDPAPLLGGIVGSGQVEDVAVSGKYTYVATSTGLQVFERNFPEEPVHLGTAGVAVARMRAEGTLVHALDFEGNLLVVDFADPTAPEVTSCAVEPGLVGTGLAGVGDHLYASLTGPYEGLFAVIDVSDPRSPVVVGRLFTGTGSDLAVKGSAAYMVLTNHEYPHSYLLVVDVADPAAPRSVTNLDLPGFATAVAVQGPCAYVSTETGISVVDLSAPLAPVLDGAVPGVSAASSLAQEDPMLYAWGRASGAEEPGLLVVDLSAPGAPALVGSESTYTYTAKLACADARVYAASNCAGLRVYDASDPAAPLLDPAYYGLPGWANHVAANATHAFVPGCTLRVVDISDPTRPAVSAVVPMAGNGHDLCLYGDYVVWVGSGANGGASGQLTLVGVGEPASPVVKGSVELTDFPLDVAVSGSYAYGAGQYDDLTIVDLSDTDSPAVAGLFEIAEASCSSVTIVGSTAYVGAVSFAKAGGLYILDLTDPTHPDIVGHMRHDAGFIDITVVGDRAYMIDTYAYDVHVVDVSDPTAPVEIGILDAVGTARALLYHAPDLYVAAEELLVVDVSEPDAPAIVGRAEFPGRAGGMALAGDAIAIAAIYDGLFLADVDCSSISAVGENDGDLPAAGAALAAHPNPFNPVTSISYRVARKGYVRLAVHDLGGRLVDVLVDRVEAAGTREVLWRGVDRLGRPVASGTYLLRLTTAAGTEAGKLTIVR